MRIIPFPSRADAGADEAFQISLEAALNGDASGAAADYWRELRDDVRALAPAMDPDFERRLRARMVERSVGRERHGASPSEDSPAATPTPDLPTLLPDSPGATSSSGRLHRWLGRSSRHRRLGTVAGLAAAVGAIVVALVIASPWSASTFHAQLFRNGPEAAHEADRVTPRAGPAFERLAPEVQNGAASGAAASAAGREQQLAASITLAASSGDLQATADRVARLAVSDGGFVQNSHVQVQQAGTSEANLALRLPSSKLSAALASLAQLAPVHAESQSLQDITDAYEAARRRLADANAERRALLRALSAATTQGQIDSLREQLTQARAAIAQQRSALQAVSQRANTAEVEVTVTAERPAGSEGLTLHRALHSAGRVLIITLAVLLVAAAIVVPLALLLIALLAGRRAWRRYRRERVLDTL